MHSPELALTVYGSNISCFTGKMEMYLRAKGLPYAFITLNGRRHMPLLQRQTGATQVPAIVLADIAFMGPMFRHFSQDPDPAEIMRQQAPAVAERVQRRLHRHGCWEPLWRIVPLASDVNRAVSPPLGKNSTML